MKTELSDFLIVGGGMAGACLGAQLASHGRVQILEMEAHPGYHSTGRSAAVFSEDYGNSVVRALTRASRDFLYHPPTGFAAAPLVKPRSILLPIRADQAAALQVFLDEHKRANFQRICGEQAGRLCPILRTEELTGALLTEQAADIDVHELHRGYLRLIKAQGGSIVTGRKVLELNRETTGLWAVQTSEGIYRASTVVNAAGAWAAEIAAMASATDIGLRPLRRTAVLLDPPPAFRVEHWPLVLDLEERFYIKPQIGKLMLSPADESPSAPCDAQPEELDIAVAIDRLERATTLQVQRIAHKWAGLRSFVADRSPVIGYDPRQPGFFWLAALGGYGIQTAPATGALAADLVLGKRPRDELTAFGVDALACSPSRLAGTKTEK